VHLSGRKAVMFRALITLILSFAAASTEYGNTFDPNGSQPTSDYGSSWDPNG
jgi:hypothetical protein